MKVRLCWGSVQSAQPFCEEWLQTRPAWSVPCCKSIESDRSKTHLPPAWISPAIVPVFEAFWGYSSDTTLPIHPPLVPIHADGQTRPLSNTDREIHQSVDKEESSLISLVHGLAAWDLVCGRPKPATLGLVPPHALSPLASRSTLAPPGNSNGWLADSKVRNSSPSMVVWGCCWSLLVPSFIVSDGFCYDRGGGPRPKNQSVVVESGCSPLLLHQRLTKPAKRATLRDPKRPVGHLARPFPLDGARVVVELAGPRRVGISPSQVRGLTRPQFDHQRGHIPSSTFLGAACLLCRPVASAAKSLPPSSR